jgi:hypothetical protein
MATRCSICNDPRTREIDALLTSRSARAIAADFGLGYRSLQRHAAQHLTVAATVADAPAGIDRISELLEAIRPIALKGGNAGLVQQYRLLLAMLAELGRSPAPYDVRRDPEWLRIRQVLHDTLWPYPEARFAVADALRALREEAAA